MAIDKVTAYTPVTETRSNVRYQVRAFYKVTSRTATQVTVDLDFQVHFPQYWSSNGSWFKFRTATKSANPNHIRGYYNWYASTGNAPRKDGSSYWLTGLKFNVASNETQLTIQVGFSNYQWAIGDFHTQNLVLDIGEGYSDIGPPSAVTRTALLNTSAVTFQWAAAPDGLNNPVKHYRVIIERASNINFTQNVTLVKEEVTASLKSRYVFSSSDPNGSFYRAKVSATDTVTGKTTKQVVSNIAERQVPPIMPQLISPAENSVVKPGDKVTVTPLSQLGGTSVNNLFIRYRLSSGAVYFLGKYQKSNVFYPPFKELMGHNPTLSWQIKDGAYTSEWSPGVKFSTGTTVTVAALSFNTTDLTNNTKAIIKPSNINGYSLSRLTETIKLQWRNTAGAWQDLKTVTRSNTGAIIHNIEIENILKLINLKYPNDLITSRPVSFRIISIVDGKSTTSATSTLSYKLPKADIKLVRIDGKSTYKYPMNSNTPIVENTFTLTISLTGIGDREKGVLNIFLTDLKTGQESVFYEKGFSGNILETKSFSPEVFGSGAYKINYSIRYSYPYPASEEGSLIGNSTITIASKPNVGYRFNLEALRTDFIKNDSSVNEVNIGYDITWNEPRAYVITQASAIIEDDKNEYVLSYGGENIVLFDDVKKYKNFNSLIRLSDILSGDVFNITHYRILDEGLSISNETLQLEENQVNVKITYKIHLKEVFRSSSSSTEPDLTLLGDQEEILEFNITANTICEPEFKDRNLGVTFERVLS